MEKADSEIKPEMKLEITYPRSKASFTINPERFDFKQLLSVA